MNEITNDQFYDDFMSSLVPGASIPPTPTLAEPEAIDHGNPLDLLDDLDAEIDDLMGDMQMENETILAPVTAALEQVEARYAPLVAAVRAKRNALESTIKADVLANGMTLKGAVYTAVYSKGRATWDSKALDGYAIAHPEIATLRKVGEPSVAIRKLGKSKGD